MEGEVLVNPFTQGRGKLVTAGVTIGAVSALMLPGPAASTPVPAGSLATGSVTTVEHRDAAPGSLTSRVLGTFGSAGRVRGTFEPDRFLVRGGKAYANGVLHATLRRGNGTLIGSVTRRITIPVRSGNNNAAAAVSQRVRCNVLNLVLGPLDLNLLGLRVQLNQVNLRITAIPGGGLLGDLLCGVTNLLNPTGLLGNTLAQVLNSLLALVPQTASAAAPPR